MLAAAVRGRGLQQVPVPPRRTFLQMCCYQGRLSSRGVIRKTRWEGSPASDFPALHPTSLPCLRLPCPAPSWGRTFSVFTLHHDLERLMVT